MKVKRRWFVLPKVIVDAESNVLCICCILSIILVVDDWLGPRAIVTEKVVLLKTISSGHQSSCLC